MFERYTENARRVIFFARYEASILGSSHINPEHLFLGLVRESRGSLAPLFGGEEQLEKVRSKVSTAAAHAEARSNSVDLPLDNGAKRVLALAAEEAERAKSHWIDGGHLFLGVLREQPKILTRIPEFASIDLERARAKIAETAFVGTPGARDNRPVVFVSRSHFWSGCVVGALSSAAMIFLFLTLKGC